MFFKKKRFKIYTHTHLPPLNFGPFHRLKSLAPELLGFLVVVLATWAFLQSARLIAITLEIKNRIVESALDGAKHLENAKDLLSNQELEAASGQIKLALENFNQSRQDLAALEKNLFGLSAILPQSKDAQNLLQASIALAEAGKSGIRFSTIAKNLSFGAHGLTSGESDFRDLRRELDYLETKLSQASQKIKPVNINNLPAQQRALFLQTKEKLRSALQSAANLKQLVALGEYFFSGQKKILLLFQNNNELRPTGGFLGSYGKLALLNGKIESLEISSIYDLDGQLSENILPPAPLLAVNQRWFLRDANWFTDFPESVKKIIAFYEKEGGETPDLTIALTPKVISELLKITGPLKTAQGEELNQETLHEQLQILTQRQANDPSNEPKKILGELFIKLFQKISEMDNSGKAQILQALQNSLVNKQLLAYAHHRKAQKNLDSFNWSGQILDADRDYLLVSSANLGGTKTDDSVEQNIKLESSIAENGRIENMLTIIRSNKMPQAAGAENKSFIRIYLPPDSKFIEATGFDPLNLENAQKPAQNFKTDRDVFAWEKSQVKDVVSGTLVGKESGKTFFGNWVVLQGGETKTLTVKYVLPFRLKKLDKHSLLIQKQPGALDYNFEYRVISPDRSIEWKNFDADVVNATLNKDQFFGMVLRKDN